MIGASAGAAACSPRHAVDQIVPLLNPPPEGMPGEPLFYRTVCRECPAGCGITARTREGRVVKLEGNPDHPLSHGALCARGQASIQGLYSPNRLRAPLHRTDGTSFAPVKWDQAIDAIAAAIRQRGASPGSLVILSRAEPGSLGALQQAIVRALGEAGERVVYEPFDPAAVRAASQVAFGRDEVPAYRIDRARTIVSFGADFLESWVSPVEHGHMLSRARAREQGRARFVFVGPALTLTAASADSWIGCAPGMEREIALALCHAVLSTGVGAEALPPQERPALAKLLANYPTDAVEKKGSLRPGSLRELAGMLVESSPSVILPPAPVACGRDGTGAALAIALLNHLLGNTGSTVVYGLDRCGDKPATMGELTALTARMKSGSVETLLVIDTDPVGTLPDDLGFAEALDHVPVTAALTIAPTATSDRCRYVLPIHHFLESFGDVQVQRGVLALGQPVMRPLYDTRQAGDVLLQIASRLESPSTDFPFKTFEDYWRQSAANHAMLQEGYSGDLQVAVRDAQRVGGFFSDAAPAPVDWQPGAIDSLSATTPSSSSARPNELPVVLCPDLLRYDGRSAAHPWMQELGDPMTTVTWSETVLFSTELATRLGVSEGDLVGLAVGARHAEFPVYVTPALANGAIGLSAGSATALRLLPATVDARSGGRAFAGAVTSVRPLGRRVELPKLEGVSRSQEGRALAQGVATARSEARRPRHALAIFPDSPQGKHRWGMSIDLDRCTGCKACVAACYAENNIPTVGAEQVALGRAMPWIRIDRFFSEGPNSPRAEFVPMLCQQCGNAPCEMVCPVEATYHSSEGLNAQIYNRCVGTFYCANNCPYKVRVFNFQDPKWPEPIPLRLNPDVSVREKGVMEKCTFCVQRIRYGENKARDEERPLRDGEIVPACAQTCPAQAITFGDLMDKSSAVSRLSGDSRAYRVFEDLKTEPAIAYLARVEPSDGQ
jgi:molybdopterin-containing oxidoreductase family iron-sulfur binding subunit